LKPDGTEPPAAEINRISAAVDIDLRRSAADRCVQLRQAANVAVVDATVGQAAEVGAPPAFRRWFQGAQAGVQVTVAMVLGVATGLLLLRADPDLMGLLLEEAPGWEFLLLMLVLALAICVSGPVVAVVVALLSRSMPAHPLARRIT
jgi:hypothetical protein